MTADVRPPISVMDGEPVGRVMPSKTETIRCADYLNHRSQHRRDGDGWVCDRCNPPAALQPTFRGERSPRTVERASPAHEPETEEGEEVKSPGVRPIAERPVPPEPLKRPDSPGSGTFRFPASRSGAQIHAQSAPSDALRTTSGHASGHRER